MKIKCLLLFVPVLLLGCQPQTSQTAGQKAHLPQTSIGTPMAATPDPESQNPANKENSEYLEWRSIRINNKLPLVTTIASVEPFLGKPDSIVQVDFKEICRSDFRSEDSKIAYYGGITFEQFGDSLDFKSIDFSKDKTSFLQVGNLRLDHSTTPQAIKTRFPKAMKDYGKDGREDVGIPPSKALSEGHWLLFFKKGKLTFFDDWFPC